MKGTDPEMRNAPAQGTGRSGERQPTNNVVHLRGSPTGAGPSTSPSEPGGMTSGLRFGPGYGRVVRPVKTAERSHVAQKPKDSTSLDGGAEIAGPWPQLE